MDLKAGTRLGAYRIDGFVASGGMGRIYRATHVDLRRPVAIKVLADEIARRPGAVERFRREARAASRLSHPHVCTVHDFAQEGEISFLVLELLEGETLEARLDRGPLPVAEVLEIGIQVAEALSHAHAGGFVHRDLKPGNIMLTRHGVKVLDFGLAKAVRGAGAGGSDRELATLTRDGRTPGTVPYMAPEQLSGRPLDARADLFALGVILYEMLAGRRPFGGPTPATTAAAVLKGSPPPLSSVRSGVPTSLERVIERCLAVEVEERWQAAADVAANLHWILDDLDTAPVGRRREEGAPPSRPRRLTGTMAAGFAVAAGVLVVAFMVVADPPSEEVITFSLDLPRGVSFTEGSRNVPVVSPDGDAIAFIATDSAGGSGLWIRPLSERGPRPVRGAREAVTPFWSPRGEALGFFDRNSLSVVPREGGPPRRVADVSMESRGGSWGRGDHIVFSAGPDRGLSLLSVDGGTLRSLTEPDHAAGEIGHLWPHFLPDGERFLYYVSSAVDSVRGVYLASLDRPQGRRLAGSDASGIYAAGNVLYLLDGNLFARTLDRAGRLTGEAVLIAEGVAATEFYQGAFSATDGGVLAFASVEGKNFTHVVRVAATGEPAGEAVEPRHQSAPALSRDGRGLALEVFAGTGSAIEVRDLASGRTRRLPLGSRRARFPVWAPAGDALAFVTEDAEASMLLVTRLNRLDPPDTLLRSRGAVIPTSWSPGGRYLAVAERTEDGHWDALVLDLEADDGAQPSRFLRSRYDEVSPQFSPEGDRMAYIANETGRFEVYVQPFPSTGARCQISSAGGFDPVWDPDGDRLYYLDPGGAMMTAAAAASGGCPEASPRRLFQTRVTTPGASRNHYAVDPDDGSFLINQRPSQPGTPEISLMLNWTSALR